MAAWSEIIKKGFNKLLSGQVVIAVSAVCLSLETFVLAGIPLGPHPVLGVIFFGSLALYNLAFLGSAPFLTFTFGAKQAAYLTVVVSFLICVVLMSFLPLKTWLPVTAGGIAGMLYLYRIRISGYFIQTRNIPLIKNIVLALIWGVITVLVPLTANPVYDISTEEVTVIFLRRFFFILAIAIPYDIRDYKIDSMGRLHTLPVALGVRKARFIAFTSLLLFVLMVLYSHWRPGKGHVPAGLMSLAFCLSAFFTAIIISLARPERKKIFFSLLLDGMMILQFILLMIVLKTARAV